MEKIGIEVNEDLKEELKELCKSKQVSMSYWVRKKIKEGIEEDTEQICNYRQVQDIRRQLRDL